MKRENLMKFLKINLILASKLKSNDKSQKIKRKSGNLTKIALKNDLIISWIKAIHSVFLKIDTRNSSGRLSLFFQ